MSNQIYQANKNVYDNLLTLLDNKVKEAESTADYSAAEKYSSIIQSLKNWTLTETNQPDPLSEEIWLEFGLERPNPITIVESDLPENDEDAELKLLLERAKVLLQKEPDKGLIDLENQIRDLISNDDGEQRLITDETISLLNKIEEKRKQVSRSLLKSLPQIEDDEAFQKQLDEAKLWNPSDPEIAEKIAKLESSRVSVFSKEKISELFNSLTDKGNVDKFSSSLRFLEGVSSRGLLILTPEEKRMIKDSRKWLDSYNRDMGVLSSVISFQNLRDTYIEFRKVRDYYNFETYMIKGEAITKAEAILILGSSLETASAIEAQKQIDHAAQDFKDSPTRAVSCLTQVLNDTEIYTFTTSDNNKIDETIKKSPFLEQDQQTIREKIDYYSVFVKKEQDALELVKKGDDETDSYEKVCYYLGSRKCYYLPDVAEKITNYVEAAKITRIDDIRRDLEDVDLKINRLEKLKLHKAKEEVERIKESINIVRKKILEPWFGVPLGADFLDVNEKQLIIRPSELEAFEDEIDKDLKNLSHKEQLIDDLQTSIFEIERLLEAGKSSEAINNYELINQNSSYGAFSAFIELSQRISKFRSFDEVLETIQRLYEINDFQGVMDYFFGVKNATAFSSGDQERKSQITKIVRESRQKYYYSRLKKYFDKRNLRATIWVLDTLRGMDFSDESFLRVSSEVEDIFARTQQIAELYTSAFASVSVRHPSPLTTVFSLIEHYRELVSEGGMSEKDMDEFRSIVDESSIYIEEDNLSNKIETIFDQFDFRQFYSSAAKIYHVAGKSNLVNTYWPRFQESLDTYDAAKTWPLIRSLLIKRIIKYVEESKDHPEDQDAVTADLVLEAFHKLELHGDKTVNRLIEDFAIEKAFKISQEARRTPGLESLSNTFSYWGKMVEYFPHSRIVQNEFGQTKIEYVLRKLKKVIKSQNWDEAENLILEHKDLIERNPSLLKTRIDFHLNKKNPNHSIELAELDLGQLTEITPDDEEIGEIFVKLEVARIKTKSNITELEVLEGINELRNHYQLRTNILEREFAELYNTFIVGHKQQFATSIQNNEYINAVLHVVDISRAEEIKGTDFHLSQELIENDTLRRNIPSVASNLFNKANGLRFKDDSDINLTKKELETILSQLRGILTMITIRYPNKDFSLPINQIVGVGAGGDIGDVQVTLSQIESRIKSCAGKLETIKKIQRALESGGIPEKWENSAKNFINGNIGLGWDKDISDGQNLIHQLSGNYVFRETTLFFDAYEQWSIDLNAIHQHYRSLRDKVSTEAFEDSLRLIREINEGINNLNDYSSEDTTTTKDNLKAFISIHAGTKLLTGLPTISEYLENCASQIDSLSKDKKRLEEKISSLKSDISNFSIGFDLYHQMLDHSERSEIKTYQDSITNLRDLIDGESFSDNIIPDFVEDNGTQENLRETQEESKPGFFNNFFKRTRGRVTEVNNPLVHSLRRDFSDKTIEHQINLLNHIIDSGKTVDLIRTAITLHSNRAMDIMDDINRHNDNIKDIITRLQACVENCEKLVSEHIMLTEEKTQELLDRKNYLTIAKAIKKSDPYVPMEKYADFRKIVINYLTRPRK